jgi:hypothetical protein
MADLVGDMGDPVKVAAAFKPVIDSAIETLAAALPANIRDALDGLTITIAISKKS